MSAWWFRRNSSRCIPFKHISNSSFHDILEQLCIVHDWFRPLNSSLVPTKISWICDHIVPLSTFLPSSYFSNPPSNTGHHDGPFCPFSRTNPPDAKRLLMLIPVVLWLPIFLKQYIHIAYDLDINLSHQCSHIHISTRALLSAPAKLDA